MTDRQTITGRSSLAAIAASVLALLAGAMPGAGRAQDSGELDDPVANRAGDGEIIVTARKRNESILKVPVIATAITQEQLTNYAVNGVNAIATQVPGLQLGEGSGNNGTQVSLRGVGAGVTNPGIEQSVSLNIDGVQMTSGNAFKMGMFDLAQVEVLKGPQSLFFGKNSPGGVISLRTADPGTTLEIIGRVSYEIEAREKRGELILSGPLSDTLGLRLAAAYIDSDGYFYNRAIALPQFGALQPDRRRFAASEEFMIRGTALFRPSGRFSARLKVNYGTSKLHGNSGQLVSCPDGTASVTGVPYIGGADCRADRVIRTVDMDPAAFPLIGNGGRALTEYDQGFGSLEMNYEATDAITVTSLSGYYKIDQYAVFNGGGTTAAGPAFGVNGDFLRRDITQELRVTSDFRDGPLNFMFGGFYQDGRIRHNFVLPGNILYRFPANLNSADHRVDLESVSLFGQLLWKPVPVIEIAVGARWTKEDREHLVVNTLPATPVVVALAKPKLSSDNLSPEVSVTYTPTDDLTLFASYKHGFKSGSFDVTGTPANGADTSFGDEKVKGGEVGLKARLADRSFYVNLGAYYYRYSDLQVGANVIDLTTGAFGVKTLNAASAKVYGVDVDLRYLPPAAPGLTISGSANWNHARYATFDTAPCWGGQLVSEGCNLFPNSTTGLASGQDLSGRELLRAPEWTATAGFDYETEVASDWVLGFGSSARYSSSYYTNFLLRDDMQQAKYFKLNARVSIRQAESGLELAVIGNNLTDKTICGTATNSNFQNGLFFGGIRTGGATRGPAGIDELSCRVERGREILLRVSLTL